MDDFDPYAELGLARDATSEDVRAAYRRRAKSAHPDGGGTAEEFGRVARAELILADPAKRKRFDETGDADDGAPDNKRAGALQIIDAFIEENVERYINGNFDPSLDPRRVDLMAALREKLGAETSGLSAAILQMKKAKGFLDDMGKRFSGDDAARPIERGFQNRIRRMDEAIAGATAAIECRRLAIEIAASYQFRQDVPQPSTTTLWVPPSAGWFTKTG